MPPPGWKAGDPEHLRRIDAGGTFPAFREMLFWLSRDAEADGKERDDAWDVLAASKCHAGFLRRLAELEPWYMRGKGDEQMEMFGT